MQTRHRCEVDNETCIDLSQFSQSIGGARPLYLGGLTLPREWDDGGTEGPERGVEARSAKAPRGVRTAEGRRSPSPVWGSGALSPPQKKKFPNLTCKSVHFPAILR